MLAVNVNKYCTLCYSLETCAPAPIYYPDAQLLTAIESRKDFEVTFHSKLRFSLHYVDILIGASRMYV